MSKRDGTLSVTGEGQITVKPDVASVRLAVITEGKTADDASRKNAEIASSMLDRITRLDIPRDDMTTVGLGVYPIYETDSTGATRLTGYRAEDSILVKAPITLAGRVYDTGIAAGANQSSAMTFGLRDPQPYRERALEAAVKTARAEADLVCRAMGVSLHAPHTIAIEQGGGLISRDSVNLVVAKVGTPILEGELTVTARVQVEYDYHA